MSFIDAAYLTHSDIVGDEIVYCRHKTGQEISIGLNPHIRRILDKWHRRSASAHHLRPILSEHDDSGNIRRKYETALRRTNKSLKQIASMAHIRTPLTTYVSRHA